MGVPVGYQPECDRGWECEMYGHPPPCKLAHARAEAEAGGERARGRSRSRSRSRCGLGVGGGLGAEAEAEAGGEQPSVPKAILDVRDELLQSPHPERVELEKRASSLRQSPAPLMLPVQRAAPSAPMESSQDKVAPNDLRQDQTTPKSILAKRPELLESPDDERVEILEAMVTEGEVTQDEANAELAALQAEYPKAAGPVTPS